MIVTLINVLTRGVRGLNEMLFGPWTEADEAAFQETRRDILEMPEAVRDVHPGLDEPITLRERMSEIYRIWFQDRLDVEVRQTAVGWQPFDAEGRPDERHQRGINQHGIEEYSRVIRPARRIGKDVRR